MSLVSNAKAIAARYQARIRRWRTALQRGLRNLAVLVEIEASKLLTGSGPPGSYPVPIRTGHLRRSLGLRVEERTAIVFNTARYARAVHDGFRPYGNPRADAIGPRPFLEDAAKRVDRAGVILAALRDGLAA